jgi:hypothetical protein
MSAATIATVPFRRCQALLAALALLGTGCTMCPDPFDYSGPVPDGSVSQNDFAARANGIIPVRSTPLPWPPIVDGRPGRPTPADDVDATVIVAGGEAPAEAAPEAVAAMGDAAPDGPLAETRATVTPAGQPTLQAVPRRGSAPDRRRARSDDGISEKPSWREAARSLFSL